jgi:hypothetical protein
VDLEKREVRPLFTVPSGDAIGGFAQNVNPFGVNTLNRALIVTRDSIRLLDFEGKTLLQVPYAPSYPTYSSVNVFSLEPTNRFAVRLDPNYWLNKKSGGKLPTHVAWVTGPNSITNTLDLPILPEPQSQEGFIEHLLSALLPPAVPVYLWDHSYKLWTLLRIVLAGLCAWAGWWLARRNNLSLKAKIGWAIFHLAFGIPALLAFLSVQEWPARESCPNCRKLRVVDREQCEHCGAAFPPPEKSGIEIFEPLTTHGGTVSA